MKYTPYIHFHSISIGASLAAAGCFLWTTHELMTAWFPPFDKTFNLAIHALLIICKIGTLLIFPFVVSCLHKTICGNRRVALSALTAYMLAGLILFTGYLVFARELFAAFASDAVIRFYYITSGALDRFNYIGLEEWRQSWQAFTPQLKDLGILLLWLLAVVLPGLILSSRKLSVSIATALSYAIMLILPITANLAVWDYDMFLGGVFTDILFVELEPFAWIGFGRTTILFFSLSFMFYLLTLLIVKRYKKADFASSQGFENQKL